MSPRFNLSFSFHAIFPCLLTAALLLGGCAHSSRKTALDRYVAAPDPSFAYQVERIYPGEGLTTYVLNLTSQVWRTESEVQPAVWRHWLTIVKPDQVSSDTALLFIGGGSNNDPPPKGPEARLVEIARRTRSVVAELRMVPNQPLQFVGEEKGRYEDALIAYTWDKYLRTGDDLWPARLPMTKSAVRAMDAITEFCRSPQGGGLTVNSYVVAGGSKRGWTTWTTAIVDPRVIAIVPIVIDLLNVEPSFRHHYRAYGFYAPAVKDYVEMGIMDWQGTPEFRSLMKMVEPYEYRDRLVLPKVIINSTGDQFFLPDSSQFYFDDLKGPKYLRYVPNTDHSLKDSDAIETLLACYHAILNKTAWPELSWQLGKDQSLIVRIDNPNAQVKLWQAANPNARDFRLETIGPAWKASPLAAREDGTYLARVPVPEKGWTAFMVEVTFPNPNGPAPFKFTTPVQVVPRTLPFPEPAHRPKR